MRRLTDNQSRQVCRWAFLMLCALPTLVVIVLASRVWKTEDWELLIAAELNLDVQIERVENPFPGRTVLHAVRVRRGAEEIGTVEQVECNWFGDWRLNLGATKLEARGLERLRLSLREMTDRQGAGGTRRAWHLRCPELTLKRPLNPAGATSIDEPAEELKLCNLELLSSPAAEETRQLLRLQLPSAAKGGDYPIEMRILQGMTSAERQVWLNVSSPTPVWLLAGLGGFPEGWDEELLFCGSLDYRQLGRGPTSGRLEAAVLSNIELGWLRDVWGVTLSGRAEIQIPALTWREGRVHQAEFQVQAADGNFSPRWLEALGRVPGVRTFELPEGLATADVIPFRLFAARFLLQFGRCRVAPINQSTAALCWDADDQPLLAIEQPGYVQTDLELLARLSLEPENPELLADDQLVELLRHFHLPPDSRSARQPTPLELR